MWLTKDEIVRLANHLKISPEETVEKYCRKIDGQFSLKENRNARGEYDCVFLKEIKPAGGKRGEVVQSKRVCGIYEVRPLQCRTWPFWTGNLSSKKAWENAGVRCHGINRGKLWTKEKMESLRDAREWPGEAPGSKD